MISENNIQNISPIDGRYANKVKKLTQYFSEFALFKYRVQVEISWLIALSKENSIAELRCFSPSEICDLEKIINDFDLNEALIIKNIENKTLHDVKAVEYYVQNKLNEHPTLSCATPFVHFALTSEDVNNISYALMLKDAVENCIMPKILNIYETIVNFAKNNKNIAMLAKTHGQPASPTTLGKEFICFAARLKKYISQLSKYKFVAKCNGAVGNFNAHKVAYPNTNWLSLSQKYIESMNLECNLYTTQIEPHDSIAEIAHLLIRINNILLDLAKDVWFYISLGYLIQKVENNQVGSSTMPHKINPIDFENAEGNLGLANALLEHFASKLPISRMQRDLSDSTVLRNLGVAFSHSYIAWQSLLHGMKKITPNYACINNELNQHWEILGEAIQTILRRNNDKDAYEKLKTLTQGQKITPQLLHGYIKNLAVKDGDKQILLNLTPDKYIGLAELLVDKFEK